jgi:prephenate dehydrogenase
MTVQITIIGLGQIGTSIGLALANSSQFTRIGFDLDNRVASLSKKMGAVDKVPFNLPNAIQDADIVLLALQMDAVKETLEMIAPDLKSGAVVLDTSPVRQAALQWAKDIIPAERYYIGFTPLVSALYLEENPGDTAAAKDDLFREGMFALTAPDGTVDAAIRLASDLSSILGAGILFADVLEIDSYMAAVHQLPQLLAAALTNVTVSRPGWNEGRKFAGRAFAQGSSSIQNLDTAEGLTVSSALNKDNVVRELDALIEELHALREEVHAGKEDALTARLKKAQKSRAKWRDERAASAWRTEGQAELDYDAARPNIFGRVVDAGRLFGRGDEEEE